MVMKKTSKSSNICLNVVIFGRSTLLNHTNMLAKNEQNLPRGFRDRPPWQPMAAERQKTSQAVSQLQCQRHVTVISDAWLNSIM